MSALAFGVPVDRASYFIPTIGIAVIGSTVAAAVMWVAGVYVADVVGLGVMVMAAPCSAIWWIRRRYRVHHERQLIFDRNGITYAAFANRRRLIPWTSVTRVVESLSGSEPDGCLLEISSTSQRLRIDGDEFEGYETIRFILFCRLPELTMLLGPCRLPAEHERDLQATVRLWTRPPDPEGAAMGLT